MRVSHQEVDGYRKEPIAADAKRGALGPILDEVASLLCGAAIEAEPAAVRGRFPIMCNPFFANSPKNGQI
jgi:hypothetical protein